MTKNALAGSGRSVIPHANALQQTRPRAPTPPLGHDRRNRRAPASECEDKGDPRPHEHTRSRSSKEAAQRACSRQANAVTTRASNRLAGSRRRCCSSSRTRAMRRTCSDVQSPIRRPTRSVQSPTTPEAMRRPHRLLDRALRRQPRAAAISAGTMRLGRSVERYEGECDKCQQHPYGPRCGLTRRRIGRRDGGGHLDREIRGPSEVESREETVNGGHRLRDALDRHRGE